MTLLLWKPRSPQQKRHGLPPGLHSHLAEFRQHVADGEIHWFIAGGGMGGGPSASGSTSTEIATWVATSFEAQTVDGVTVYDLSPGVQ